MIIWYVLATVFAVILTYYANVSLKHLHTLNCWGKIGVFVRIFLLFLMIIGFGLETKYYLLTGKSIYLSIYAIAVLIPWVIILFDDLKKRKEKKNESN